jgi:hypothetical protein
MPDGVVWLNAYPDQLSEVQQTEMPGAAAEAALPCEASASPSTASMRPVRDLPVPDATGPVLHRATTPAAEARIIVSVTFSAGNPD